MIFVDTGAWFARYVAEDVDHSAAVAWFPSSPDMLVTTDYVVDELLTLLKVRGFANIAFSVGGKLLAGQVCNGRFFRSIVIKAGVSLTAQASP